MKGIKVGKEKEKRAEAWLSSHFKTKSLTRKEILHKEHQLVHPTSTTNQHTLSTPWSTTEI